MNPWAEFIITLGVVCVVGPMVVFLVWANQKRQDR